MVKSFFKRLGISVIVLACVGGIFLKYNSNNEKDVDASIKVETNNNELEDTYIDDGYNDSDGNSNLADNDKDIEVDDEKEDINNNFIEDVEIEVEDNKVESDIEENATASTHKTGSFQGFADSNFVEIKVGDSYATYRVSSDVKDILSKKDIDSSITFKVTDIDGQQVITDIR